MLCRKPFRRKGGFTGFGCGSCLPCRFNRRRIWTHRLLLESFFHEFSSFVTLTYNDEFLPPNSTLIARDTQLFLKRLRKKLKGHKIRYFLVGEYGHEGKRQWNPHYHLALYGFPPCFTPQIAVIERRKKKNCPCKSCRILASSWIGSNESKYPGKNMGLVHSGKLEKDSAQYIAGYVTKKLTTEDNDKNRDYRREKGILLDGRLPEFARMSRNPGIGAYAVPSITESVMSASGFTYIEENGDVPSQLRHGKQKWPLGRYLKGKLRLGCGFKEEKAPQEVLHSMCEKYEIEKDGIRLFDTKAFLEDQEKNKQKALNLEKRTNIYTKPKGL